MHRQASACELTEVLGADPDGEVLLRVLREAHALHNLLHCGVVAVLELHGAVRAVHAVDAHFLILWKEPAVMTERSNERARPSDNEGKWHPLAANATSCSRFLSLTHRFAGGLLQEFDGFLPLVLLVLLTHLQRGSLLLVLYVLWEDVQHIQTLVLWLMSSPVSSTNIRLAMPTSHFSYPVDLRLLQQELHDFRVPSSGCKVERGAELPVEQVWIAATFLQ